jgi:sphingolipid delta-4 desaturase
MKEGFLSGINSGMFIDSKLNSYIMKPQTDFFYSNEKEPHRIRTKSILKAHPEVKQFIGRNPYTFLAVLTAVSLQIACAWMLKDQPWWLILIVAYCIGAFADHVLFTTIHEASHNLIFKKKNWNVISGLIANLPSVVPSAVSFQRYHIKHHSFQGVHELDGDLPYHWEARLISGSPFAKAMWLLFYPVFQVARTFRLKEIKPIDSWVVTNFLTQALFTFLICYFMGPMALLYLLLSFFFSIGLHPLGGRWIQEHFLKDSMQETYSYYGILNTINMNIGYHNEHHDFPSIPWNNLPKLKQTAAEFYDPLISHRSWTKLLIRFLFDKKITLYSRIVRKERAKVPLSDASTPDLDMTKVAL